MRKSLILTSALSLVALTGCSIDKPVEDHNLIVISHHYPSYLNCGYGLEVAINNIPTAGFEDTVAEEKVGDVACSGYGRNEDNNSASNFKHLCYTHDYGEEGSDRTCVIGTNFNQFAVGMVDLIIGEAKNTKD